MIRHARPHRAAPTGHRGHCSDRQRGATIVEAAIAIPIFIVVLMGLVDLGTGVLKTSQASSAAADGARAGMLWSNDPLNQHNRQDVAGSPENNAIVTAAKTRIVGEGGNIVVAVTCVGPTSLTPRVGGCADADPQRDRLRVTVRWRWNPITFVGRGLPIQDIKGDTTMGLVGLPITPVPLP